MDYITSFTKAHEVAEDEMDWPEEKEVLPRTALLCSKPINGDLERAVRENTKWTMLNTRAVGSLRADMSRLEKTRVDPHGALAATLLLGMAIGYLLK